MITVHVEAAVVGRKRSGAPVHELAIAVPPGPTAVRDLIESVVRAELAAASTRAEEDRVVRVLTETALQEGLASGAVRSGGRDAPDLVDPADAVRTAIEAHDDGLYQTIIGEHPIDDLDAVVELCDGTLVMFVRLVPLAGG